MFCFQKLLSESRERIAVVGISAFALLSIHSVAGAQELFPLSEPASTVPKGVLGLRLFSETYDEVNQWRNASYLRLMYGATPRLSLYLSAIASNHHGDKLPVEFPFHNTPERGAYYPYQFNGFWTYAKFRFLSLDAAKSHFRMAGYAELSKVKTTHHETEPDLEMGDNSGLGFGFITTMLKNKLAVSLMTGLILPFPSHNFSPDPIRSLPDIPETVFYGKAVQYRLSFGYRLLPVQYKNYRQGNLNLYAEFGGKVYGAARVNIFSGQPNEYYLDNARYPDALKGGFYVDFSPGIQYIFHSNLRLDFSTTFRWLGFSYAQLYPVFSIGIQRYFYPKK